MTQLSKQLKQLMQDDAVPMSDAWGKLYDSLLAAEAQEPVADIYAELYRLREDIKGPDGFDTWKDAALSEKKARIKCEEHINKSVQDIDYLTAMAAFHSDDWHKMGPITAYMHGWNARKAIIPDPNITRDALRYRFLRDKDAFGADNEPGLVNWDELVDLELNDFDAATDARMSHPNVAWAAQFSAPQPVAVPDEIEPTVEAIKNILPTANPDEYAACVGADMWNACRAAMLNAEPVSRPYTLPQWIPCSERMPEDGQHVIIFCDGAFVISAQYRDGDFFDVVRDGEEFFETVSRCVTHWMPLPAAPQEPTK